MKATKDLLATFNRDERGDLLTEFVIGLVLVLIISVAGFGIIRNSFNTTSTDLAAAQNIVEQGTALAHNSQSGVTLTVTPSGSGSHFALTNASGNTIASITTKSQFDEVVNGENESSWTASWTAAGIVKGCTTQYLAIVQISPNLSGGSRHTMMNCYN